MTEEEKVENHVFTIPEKKLKLWDTLLTWGEPLALNEIKVPLGEDIDRAAYTLEPYELDLLMAVFQGDGGPVLDISLIDGNGSTILIRKGLYSVPKELDFIYKDTRYHFDIVPGSPVIVLNEADLMAQHQKLIAVRRPQKA